LIEYPVGQVFPQEALLVPPGILAVHDHLQFITIKF
jgi:hypothetical protein